MLKINIDKQLLKYLDAYCTIMDIDLTEYIRIATETSLNKDLSKIKGH